MFKIVSWDFKSKCELCGNDSNHINMVVELNKNESVYFPACHDCTNGKIISDSILNVWNSLSNKLQRRCC